MRQWFGYHLALVVKDEPKKYNCINLANKDQSKTPPWVDELADDIKKAGGLYEYFCAKGDKKACNDVKRLKK